MQLHCQQDGDTGEWDLSEYTARFTRPIILPTEHISGIDVLSLDRSMATVNWGNVMRELPIGSPYKKELFRKMIALEHAGQKGRNAFDLLSIKHWTGTGLYDPNLDDLKKKYVTEQHFTAKEPHIENIRFCYQLLSGRFDQYMAKLEDIGFSSPLYLKRMLAYSEGDFQLVHHKVMPEGIMTVTIPLLKKGGTYQMDNYKVKLTATPPIIDGVYNGVDTSVLQQEMKQINWQDEDSHYKHVDGEEPRFVEEVERIVEQLQYVLADEPFGRNVSSQIQLKYWAESPDFGGIIDNETWDYLNSLTSEKLILPIYINIMQGYQLMTGNVLFYKDQSEMVGQWMHAVPDPDQPGALQFRSDKGIASSQLKRLLQLLPCGKTEIDAALNDIKNGRMGSVILNNGQPVRVSVDPFQGQLKLFSADGMPIHHQLYQLSSTSLPLKDTVNKYAFRGAKHLLKLQQHKRKKGKGL